MVLSVEMCPPLCYNDKKRRNGKKMAQKNKITFTVRMDEEMYKKMLAVAAFDGCDENNHILHLVRTNIAYHERIHGKIDSSKVVLPEKKTETEAK